MSFKTILVEIHERVGLIRFNRPDALNALNGQVIAELNAALESYENDKAIGSIVVTGSDKAFAAGADIREMAAKTYPDIYLERFGDDWDRIARTRKPTIAAVAGLALGGGCEVAMMCDFIIAAENARFGQPEIKLGIMPGSGGTQRLVKLIGRAKAMELCLTGRLMPAVEAERLGLVARVVPTDGLLQAALETAASIASHAQVATLLTKEAIHRADELPLAEGLRFERRVMQALFATRDQKEGMQAFMEKRPAKFSHD